MNSYTKYVLRQLLTGMLLVSAGLTCIIWLSQSLRFVEMIVNRGLSAGTFVYMTMLLLPNFFDCYPAYRAFYRDCIYLFQNGDGPGINRDARGWRWSVWPR